MVPVTGGALDLGPWEQVFYAEFDGQRKKRVSSGHGGVTMSNAQWQMPRLLLTLLTGTRRRRAGNAADAEGDDREHREIDAPAPSATAAA